MAITRLWQAGIETGNVFEFTTVTANMTASTTQKKTGTYSLQGDGNQQFINALVTIPATRQIRCGYYYYTQQQDGSEVKQVFLRDVSGNDLIALEGKGSDGGSHLILDIAGTNQDTEAGANTASTWFHIGIDVKVHSSAGWAKVYKNGVEILSFSGNTGNADIVSCYFGWWTPRPYAYIYYDDLFIDDTTGESAAAVVPIKRFYYVAPNDDGNYDGTWDGSDGNSVDNYQLVDEIPASETDYVSTNVADELESYAMGTVTLGTGETFDAVIPIAYVKRASTTEQIALGTRYSSTDVVGSDQNPGTSSDYLWERQTTKPGGGAWDQTAVDGMEVIVKSRGTY